MISRPSGESEANTVAGSTSAGSLGGAQGVSHLFNPVHASFCSSERRYF